MSNPANPPPRTSGAEPATRAGAWGGRHHMTIIAAVATLLATAPLATLFENWTWLAQCALAIAAVAAAGALLRSLRVPAWGQLPGTLAALLLALTILFASGEEFFGFLPTASTLEHFGVLLGEVPQVVATEALPVGDYDGLLLLTMLGVGLVAVVVDLLAVGLRRPALTGLPMLAVYSVPVAVSHESVSGFSFLVGVLGYLWLVATDNLDRVRRFGRRFTGEGRDVQPWEPSPLAAAGRRLTVVGVLIALALPLAVPGMTTGLIDRFGTGFPGGSGEGRGGNPAAVNLFAALDGLLNRDTTVELLRVTTDDPEPFYLRVGTADQITGQGFNHRAPRGTPVNELPQLPQPRVGVTQHRHRAAVEVLAWDMNRLPAYPELAGVTGVDDQWRYDAEQQVIFSEGTGASGYNYELEYVRRQFTAEALRQSRPLPDDHPVREQFGDVLPEPEVSALVSELTGNLTTPYDQVLAILGHFSLQNGFRYSLDTGSATSGSAIVDFLFVNQSGFCVQYAAAMAWMVREAGLPARVAIGFTRGRQLESGTYLMTNHNLHAWTEVYFDGFGWVPFDPTPSGSVAGSASNAWAPDPNAPRDPQGPDGGPGSPGASGTPLPPGDGPAELDVGGGGAVSGLSEQRGPRWQLWLLAAAGLVVAMLLAPALRRAQLRRQRTPRQLATEPTALPHSGDPATGLVTSGTPEAAARHWAHQAWEELLDTMTDYQIALDPAETPRSTAERLVRECRLDADGFAEAAAGARELGRAEERASYARAPGSAAGLLAAQRAVRKALAGQSGRWVRWRASLLPPSTLARWRSGTMDAISRLALAGSRFAETAARFSPRRLLGSSSS